MWFAGPLLTGVVWRMIRYIQNTIVVPNRWSENVSAVYTHRLLSRDVLLIIFDMK